MTYKVSDAIEVTGVARAEDGSDVVDCVRHRAQQIGRMRADYMPVEALTFMAPPGMFRTGSKVKITLEADNG